MLLPAQRRGGDRRVGDPRAIIPGLVEWWNASSGPTTDLAGSTPVVNTGDSVGAWKGLVAGTVVPAQGLGNRDTWVTNKFGSRPAVAFSGSNNGLIGTLNHTFANGVTFIVLGQFEHASLAFRSIMSISDGSGNPASIAGGLLIDVGSAATTLEVARNSVSTTWGFTEAVPYMIVARLWKGAATADIGGVTTKGSIQQLYVNGGQPVAYGFADLTSSIAATTVSLGARADSNFGAKFSMADAFLIDGALTPKTLQRFVQGYVLPWYGSGVF